MKHSLMPIGFMHVFCMGDINAVRITNNGREAPKTRLIIFSLAPDSHVEIDAPGVVEGREIDDGVVRVRELDRVESTVAVHIARAMASPRHRRWLLPRKAAGLRILAPGSTFIYDNGKVTING